MTPIQRVRHKKRGTTYVVIDYAQLQTAEPISDMRGLTIYRSEESGILYARPSDEFLDGRFEELPLPAPTPDGRDEALAIKTILQDQHTISAIVHAMGRHRAMRYANVWIVWDTAKPWPGDNLSFYGVERYAEDIAAKRNAINILAAITAALEEGK